MIAKQDIHNEILIKLSNSQNGKIFGGHKEQAVITNQTQAKGMGGG
jgi:hypothetical protein